MTLVDERRRRPPRRARGRRRASTTSAALVEALVVPLARGRGRDRRLVRPLPRPHPLGARRRGPSCEDARRRRELPRRAAHLSGLPRPTCPRRSAAAASTSSPRSSSARSPAGRAPPTGAQRRLPVARPRRRARRAPASPSSPHPCPPSKEPRHDRRPRHRQPRTRSRSTCPGPRIASRTPEGWVDEPYTRFTCRPLAPTIGAVIGGVSLADPVDEELFHQLNRALLEWKVIFFRDQDLTPQQQAAFAAHWGPLESHPFIGLRDDQREEAPEVVRLEKGAELQRLREHLAQRRHLARGPLARIGAAGHRGARDRRRHAAGPTWAPPTTACPTFVRDRIDGLVAEHDWIVTFGRFMDAERKAALRKDFPPAHHPVVRTHPETGRRTLYVNRAFTQHLVGVDPDESRRAPRDPLQPGRASRSTSAAGAGGPATSRSGTTAPPSTTPSRTTPRSAG